MTDYPREVWDVLSDDAKYAAFQHKEKMARIGYAAIECIAAYTDPDDLQEDGEDEYGVSGSECIEMAYDNVLCTARSAKRNMDALQADSKRRREEKSDGRA